MPLQVLPESMDIYNFRKGDEQFQLPFALTATAADAVRMIAERFGADEALITLLWRGRILRSQAVLSRQRIPPDAAILVDITDLDEIIRRSQGSRRVPGERINVSFVRRGAPSLDEVIHPRDLIRDVKMTLGERIGMRLDDFDLIYRDSTGRDIVLPETAWVYETGIREGSRILIHVSTGDQLGQLLPGSADSWEQDVRELL
jgi:hypothetical protein